MLVLDVVVFVAVVVEVEVVVVVVVVCKDVLLVLGEGDGKLVGTGTVVDEVGGSSGPPGFVGEGMTGPGPSVGVGENESGSEGWMPFAGLPSTGASNASEYRIDVDFIVSSACFWKVVLPAFICCSANMLYLELTRRACDSTPPRMWSEADRQAVRVRDYIYGTEE